VIIFSWQNINHNRFSDIKTIQQIVVNH